MPACKMVLLMNPDTLGDSHNMQPVENAQQIISMMLSDAWQTVAGVDRDGVTGITTIIIHRSGRGTFTTPLTG